MNWKTSTGEKENSVSWRNIEYSDKTLYNCPSTHMTTTTTSKLAMYLCQTFQTYMEMGKYVDVNITRQRQPPPHSNEASSHCKQAKMCERNWNERCLFFEGFCCGVVWSAHELRWLCIFHPDLLTLCTYNQQANGHLDCSRQRTRTLSLLQFRHCNPRRLNNMKCVIM